MGLYHTYTVCRFGFCDPDCAPLGQEGRLRWRDSLPRKLILEHALQCSLAELAESGQILSRALARRMRGALFYSLEGNENGSMEQVLFCPQREAPRLAFACVSIATSFRERMYSNPQKSPEK